MRHALRRLFWTLPTLVGVSILSFWFLSYVPDPTDDPAVIAATAPQDLARMRRERFLDLPRFLNPAPKDVSARAAAAVADLAEREDDDPRAEGARRELARLGGAALREVIPSLDALSPERRVRAALALAPIALRMHLPHAEDAGDPARAVAFWARFWEDRGVEFRRGSAHSDVGRLLRYHAAETADDVRQLDTYALAELFAALEVPDDAGSLFRARTVVGLMADVTGREDRIAPDDDLPRGREVAERWLAFWNVYKADYVALRGASRVSAMLLETRYGKWAASAIGSRLGTTSTGATVIDELWQRAPITILLVVGAIFFGYAIAIPLGAASARSRGRPVDLGIACAVLGLYAVPTAVLAVLVARTTGAASGRILLGIVVLGLGLVASPTRQLRSALASSLSEDCVRAAQARGASLFRATFVHGLRLSLLPLVTLAALEAPMALGGAFVVERVFGLRGIGELTIQAVLVRDTSWLMALSIVAALFAAVFLLATDLGYVVLDRRFTPAILARQERG